MRTLRASGTASFQLRGRGSLKGRGAVAPLLPFKLSLATCSFFWAVHIGLPDSWSPPFLNNMVVWASFWQGGQARGGGRQHPSSLQRKIAVVPNLELVCWSPSCQNCVTSSAQVIRQCRLKARSCCPHRLARICVPFVQAAPQASSFGGRGSLKGRGAVAPLLPFKLSLATCSFFWAVHIGLPDSWSPPFLNNMVVWASFWQGGQAEPFRASSPSTQGSCYPRSGLEIAWDLGTHVRML